LDDLIGDFIAETREGLESLDSQLVRFEQCPDDPATLGEIFRLIHTIKGTCGFLGLTRLQGVAHAAENVLGGFRDGSIPVTPQAVTAVLETVDLIRGLIDALATAGVEPEGDDSALVARLEAVLEPGAAAMVGAPAAPAAAAPSEDRRPLIVRLGGDAALDAASEMALPTLRARDPFAACDPDTLQGAMRDALAAFARGQGSASVAAAIGELTETPPPREAVEAAIEAVLAQLGALDADAGAVAELRELARATLPEAVVAAAPEPTPRAARPAPPAPRLVEEFAPTEPAGDPAVAARPVAEASQPAQTIRVSVDALEHLMTVVSELVLIRNQLIQTLRLEPDSAFAAPLNRLNQVTSELQEGVMTTRMQPISGAWAKLPRLVRDLAQELGKTIDLVMFGQETELDRQVLELIKDPLTHMIRNAADHGLETPAERRAAGKAASGRITLQARHEGGAIVIEVADDGKGMSAGKIRAKAVASGLLTQAQADQMSDDGARQLIFTAGFSTAAQVTAVSGRGVGMDVVRTNIEKIGGAIELSSVEGAGSRFTIRIPLTLTIVSALIVECCGERFAMPQSSVVELVSANDASGRSIEYIDGSAVLRLRDRLLPLVSLQALLKLEPASEPTSEACIVVARVGSFTFGVIVDRVFDTEEIVVKPVATVLRHLKLYSGATILGDGAVILILDPKGMSSETGAGQVATGLQEEEEAAADGAGERSAILVFRAGGGALKAAPLASVSRIEEVGPRDIEQVEGRSVMQYRGKLMPIVSADATTAAWTDGQSRPLLVFAREHRAVGLLVSEIVDIVETVVVTDLESAGPGSRGSLIIEGRATELIDVDYYWRRGQGETAPLQSATVPATPASPAPRRLLVVDRSPFSQMLLRPLLSQAGYEVTVATQPEAALALYDAGERFQLIIADTSKRDEARAFAAAFQRAEDWHATPVLSLALNQDPAAPPGQSPFDRTTLLDAVNSAVAELRGAA
jgi:two-component system chemotaxis sensor kinase CheA